MDYQLMGLVFACIGVVMSVLYLMLGVSVLEVLRKRHVEQPAAHTNDAE